METTFHGIKYDPDRNGKYKNGTIVGEHGHRYALFNASDADWYLPIGYFISRVAAYKVAKEGRTEQDFHDILGGFVEAYRDNDDFFHNLFVGMAKDAGLNRTSTINMAGIAGFEFPPTVGDIGLKYQDLSKKWQNRQDNIHSNLLDAAAGDVGDLALAASHIHLRPRDLKQNIVIFGHTHNDEMWANISGLNRLFLTTPKARKNSPKRLIYVNCGTWVDSKRHCTYVETEENIAEKRHYVRLLEYPGPKLLKERFVEL